MSESAERFNSLSHLVGAVLSACGLVALLARSLRAADWIRPVSLGVYGASLVLLYTASALYHGLRGRPKAVLRRLDHLSIYLLIAGTYTPFALISLRGSWGRPLLALIWALAALGVVLEFLPGRRLLSVALYLGMGWLVLIVARPLARELHAPGLLWLLAGGLCYTLGTAFYVLGRRHPQAHGVFHLFVLAGSLSHYVVIWAYVA